MASAWGWRNNGWWGLHQFLPPPRHPGDAPATQWSSVPPRRIIGVIELPAVIDAGGGDLAWCGRGRHSLGNQPGSRSSFPFIFSTHIAPTCAQAAKEALNKNAEHTDVDPGYAAMEAVGPSPHRPSSALFCLILYFGSTRQGHADTSRPRGKTPFENFGSSGVSTPSMPVAHITGTVRLDTCRRSTPHGTSSKGWSRSCRESSHFG